MESTAPARISRRGYGDAKKSLAELGDDELDREAKRRRRARTKGGDSASVAARPERAKRRSKRRMGEELSRYYANLELDPGASLDEVRTAYERLMAKYHPERFTDDPTKRRMAARLADSLTSAYKTLDEYLSRD